MGMGPKLTPMVMVFLIKTNLLGGEEILILPGVVWKTNPLSMDTDGDSLNDYVDSFPFTVAINPLDSLVSFTMLELTSSQGGEWIDTTTISDSFTTIQVNQIMRGPTALCK